MDTQISRFHTRTGQELSGVSLEKYLKSRESLISEYGITELQIVEAASFSLTMVIRVALGLSANQAQVAAIVSDCLAGRVVLAALRQLANAGATVVIVHIDNPANLSAATQHQLKAHEAMGVDQLFWESRSEDADFRELFRNCHNLMLGALSPGAEEHPALKAIAELLNELQTPVHCLEHPPGMNPNTGEKTTTPLYASSTLSLGLPFSGLEAGSEYAGRIYLCDISFPQSYYADSIGSGAPLFSEQPVIQILPGPVPPPKPQDS